MFTQEQLNSITPDKTYAYKGKLYKALALCENCDGEEFITLCEEDNVMSVIALDFMPEEYIPNLVTVPAGAIYFDKDNNTKANITGDVVINTALDEKIVFDSNRRPVTVGNTYKCMSKVCDTFLIIGPDGDMQCIEKTQDGIHEMYFSPDMLPSYFDRGGTVKKVREGRSPFTLNPMSTPLRVIKLRLTNTDFICDAEDLLNHTIITSTLSGLTYIDPSPRDYIIDDTDTILRYDISNGLSDKYSICSRCGEIVTNSDIVNHEMREAVGLEENVCHECFDRMYTWCSHEDRYVTTDQAVSVDGENYSLEYANEHFYECSLCHTFHSEPLRFIDETDDYVCETCIRNNYEETDDGTLVRVNFNVRAINAYGYTPRLKFRGEGDKFIGLEWELDSWARLMRRTNELACRMFGFPSPDNFWYCKRDGSLRYGFEAVSHPATPEYWMESVDFGRLCQLARKYGFDEEKTAGIHMHVNRNYFNSNRCIGHLIRFFEENYDEILKLTGRDERQAREFADKYRIDSTDSLEIYEKSQHESRYKAVNLTNEDTIEIRIFPSVLRPNIMRAFIQFVDVITVLANIEWYSLQIENIYSKAEERNYNELLSLLEEKWAKR